MPECPTATWGSKAGQKEGGNTTAVMIVERRERGGGAVTPGAESLGGHCIPVTGRQRGDTLNNIKHEALSIEVKSRRALPAWRSKKLRGGGPRGPRSLATNKVGGTTGRGVGGEPDVLFDSWFWRGPSLARVPLFTRVLQPSYDQIIVCFTLIYH